MHKKLTITIEEQIYNNLHSRIGNGKISQFIENLVRPYVMYFDLEKAYKEMAQDEEREHEANEWVEGVIDIDETR